MKGKKAVTMREIAAEAGVTAATVSLVLRSSTGRVSASTRENVLRIARRLGYTADPYRATLMNKRRKGTLPKSSPVLAFATGYSTAEGWRGNYPNVAGYFEGARERAAELGFRLEPFWLGENARMAKRVGQIMYTRSIKGLLLAPLPDFLSSLKLDWDRFYTVALGFSLAVPAIDRVSSDHLQCMVLAINRCRELGYRRIGLVMSPAHHQRADRRWMAAYLMEQERSAMVKVRPLLIDDGDAEGLRSWLRQERPDVVIAPYSRGALQRRLRAPGLRVPEDLGVVELDLPGVDGSVSGVCENSTLVGARAVELLAAALNRNDCGVPKQPTTLFVDSFLTSGPTLLGDLKEAESGINPVAEKQTAPKASHVTIRDIAVRTAVSPATVSLALRGSPRIPPSTTERILGVANELGYRRNAYLSELMKNTRQGLTSDKKPVLGFLTAYPDRDGWKDCYLFHQYFLGARRRARELGFQLREIWVFEPEHGPDLGQYLRGEAIQGVMFAPFPNEGADFPFPWKNFCALAFGFTPFPHLPLHRIANDHYRTVGQAIRECHALGYRRIGFAIGDVNDVRVQHRWSSSFFLNQRECPEGLSLLGFIPDQWDRETLLAWFEKERPEVLLTFAADDVRQWLNESGYEIPRDIVLVSLNVFGPAREWLSGIDQDGELLGSRAVDILVGLIERSEYGLSQQPTTLLLEGKWKAGRAVPRRTLPP